MENLHSVQNEQKVLDLIESIECDGWVGPPLVRWDDIFITGVHRCAAVSELGWADYQIPSIDIEEVFNEAGLDFYEVWKEEGEPTAYDHDFVYVCEALPFEIADKYGIDIH